MDPICPACRQKDRTCKVRFLADQPFFSCKPCFEEAEKRQPGKPRGDLTPLEQMGYKPGEPKLMDR